MHRSVNDPKRQSPYNLQNRANDTTIRSIPAFEKEIRNIKGEQQMNAQEFIDEYMDNLLNIEKLNREEQALIDSVLTPEIKEKLNEIEAEFAPKITELSQRNQALIQMAKGEVLSQAVEQLQSQLPKEM